MNALASWEHRAVTTLNALTEALKAEMAAAARLREATGVEQDAAWHAYKAAALAVAEAYAAWGEAVRP